MMGDLPMIDLQTGDFLDRSIDKLLIPSERVAHVQIGNNLEHTLLVLTKTGYTGIPVLDAQYKLHGLITTPLILDAIMGIERIEFEKLDKIAVEDVMNKDIPILNVHDSVRKGLKLLINLPFICAVNDQGYFEGLLTRSAVLKQLNHIIYKKV
jgi:predicted transcriptional regulator